MRFMMIDAPTDANLEAYIVEMKKANVANLVRACESTYSKERVEQAGIRVWDCPFPDGDPPPEAIIVKWLQVCESTFAKGNSAKQCVAVHCIAGLGRTPVLVAIALIEQGMEALDAVAAIRAKRRGAINAKQLAYLENSYKRRSKAKCSIM